MDVSVVQSSHDGNGADPLLRLLGPGLVTGAADDDPSGIATYAQAGAQFGYGLLWDGVSDDLVYDCHSTRQALMLSIAAAVAIFRLKAGIIPTLATSCAASVILYLAGALN